MSAAAIVVHLLTLLLLGVGLSGLSVGISAWLPNFRETDPSKIVLGFGGTVNMLVSLGYLVVVIAAACGPFHAASAQVAFGDGTGPLPGWAFAGLPVAVALAANAVSREHARIIPAGGQYFVEDLQSRNKTYVNNKQVDGRWPNPLKNGDNIKICDFLFAFQDEAGKNRGVPADEEEETSNT